MYGSLIVEVVFFFLTVTTITEKESSSHTHTHTKKMYCERADCRTVCWNGNHVACIMGWVDSVKVWVVYSCVHRLMLAPLFVRFQSKSVNVHLKYWACMYFAFMTKGRCYYMVLRGEGEVIIM